MSSYKHEAKASRGDKLKKYGVDKAPRGDIFTDDKPYDGVPILTTDTPSGKQPVGKQRFRRGGKVAHLVGQHAHKNLGKASRHKRDDGGKVPTPPHRPIPLPPRRSTSEEYEYYNPNEPSDLGSKSTGAKHGGKIHKARGGVLGATPQQRKKVIGAMVARKKQEGLPSAPPGSRKMVSSGLIPSGMKRGGHAHPDEAEDRKLVRKMVKPEALQHRTHKAGGGGMGISDIRRQFNQAFRTARAAGLDTFDFMGKSYNTKLAPTPTPTPPRRSDTIPQPGSYQPNMVESSDLPPMPSADQQRGMMGRGAGMPAPRASSDVAPIFRGRDRSELEDRAASGTAEQMGMGQYPQLSDMGGAGEVAPGIPAPLYKRGGRAEKCWGGETKRTKRKSGGRVGKGKTTVNIMISPQQGGQQPQMPLGAGVGMGMPPVVPPMPPAMPPMPPGMGPAGAGPGLGAMGAMAPGRPGMSAPVPPMRKSGGRVGNWMPKYEEKDYGSGSGLGRLQKTKWPPADGTE